MSHVDALVAAVERFLALDDGDEPLLWNFTENLEEMRAAVQRVKDDPWATLKNGSRVYLGNDSPNAASPVFQQEKP